MSDGVGDSGPGDPRGPTPRGRRAGSRIAIGFVLGPIVGGLLGLLVGVLAFDAGSRGMWASLVAGAVFGLLGGFWGGLSSLGPPEAENDPLPRTTRDPDEPGGREGSTTVG